MLYYMNCYFSNGWFNEFLWTLWMAEKKWTEIERIKWKGIAAETMKKTRNLIHGRCTVHTSHTHYNVRNCLAQGKEQKNIEKKNKLREHKKHTIKFIRNDEYTSFNLALETRKTNNFGVGTCK